MWTTHPGTVITIAPRTVASRFIDPDDFRVGGPCNAHSRVAPTDRCLRRWMIEVRYRSRAAPSEMPGTCGKDFRRLAADFSEHSGALREECGDPFREVGEGEQFGLPLAFPGERVVEFGEGGVVDGVLRPAIRIGWAVASLWVRPSTVSANSSSG